MTNPVLKKTVFLSLLGHLTVFSIFNLSFGKVILKENQAPLCFLGQVFLPTQFNIQPAASGASLISRAKIDLGVLRKDTGQPVFLGRYNKPHTDLVFSPLKETFVKKIGSHFLAPARREQAIIFHPPLPYYFNLYFKDRQVAHVELGFNIISSAGRNSIAVKRKISSGNLEVDLLSMRYIGYYLFIQQARFASNHWQVVKIDLSAKDD
jgi:hypothetical protein